MLTPVQYHTPVDEAAKFSWASGEIGTDGLSRRLVYHWLLGAYALLTGGPLEASFKMIEAYQTAVGDNCSRLSKAR